MNIDQLIDALQAIKSQNITLTNRLDTPVVLLANLHGTLWSGELFAIGLGEWRGEVCAYVEGKTQFPVIKPINGI
jgi:hypothetical protein